MRCFSAGLGLLIVLVASGCGGGGGSPSTSTTGSGNGEAAKSGKQVFLDATKAANAASSFHMSGQIATGGKNIGVDLSLVKGKGAKGSLTLGGLPVDLIVLDKNAYMKADAAFWKKYGGKSGSAVAQLVAGRWFKFPTSNPQFGGFAAFANAGSIFNALKTGNTTVTNKGATKYKGQDVVDLYGGSSNGDLYVAATGTPYPLALAKTGSSSSGSIVFDQWNKPVTLTAPSGAIDVSQFSH